MMVCWLSSLSLQAQRFMEKLTRGIVALPVKEGRVYLSWRLLKEVPKDVSFNIYRSIEGENAKPITQTTDFIEYTYVAEDIDPRYAGADNWVPPVDYAPEKRLNQVPICPNPYFCELQNVLSCE